MKGEPRNCCAGEKEFQVQSGRERERQIESERENDRASQNGT